MGKITAILIGAGLRLSLIHIWEEFYSACQKIQTWSETSNKDVMPLGPTVEGYLYITDQMLAKNRGRGSVAISQNKVPMSQPEICTVLEPVSYTHLRNKSCCHRWW